MSCGPSGTFKHCLLDIHHLIGKKWAKEGLKEQESLLLTSRITLVLTKHLSAKMYLGGG